jgi:LysM repeat protein
VRNLVIFIEDQIRDERVCLKVDASKPVEALIEWYVDDFGLPRLDFGLRRIEYWLVRAVDKTYISGRMTLHQARIAQGELLQLVSPKGRRVWRVVQRLLDEIESEIEDRVTEKIEDTAKKVRDRVTKKWAEIEKTHAGDQRVEVVGELVKQLARPTTLSVLVKPVLANLPIGGKVILLAGALLLYNVVFPPDATPVSPEPTERPVVTTRAPERVQPTTALTLTPTPKPPHTIPSEKPNPEPTDTPTTMPTSTHTPTSPCIRAQPAGWVSYVVKAGNTLFSLARLTGTTVADIQQVNCLSGTTIRVGERLWLPATPKTDTPTATATSTLIPTITSTPTPTIRPKDCLPYNPHNLRIVDEGARGLLLTDGRMRMEMLDNKVDAQDALALAQRHTAQCFIGRGNKRPNRMDYIVEYWTGDSRLETKIRQVDCLPYNPHNLRIVDEGARGWLLTDGRMRMEILDNEVDAKSALILAQNHTRQCFIGRGNTRPDRKNYIVQYWE